MTPDFPPARRLYEAGHGSLIQCREALWKCKGDELLAEGYLKYNGCAINITPKEAYDAWVMQKAREWKEHLENNRFRQIQESRPKV